ncbi:hypothetical protein ACU4GD_35860 [Cupriavidus basilensis]
MMPRLRCLNLRAAWAEPGVPPRRAQMAPALLAVASVAQISSDQSACQHCSPAWPPAACAYLTYADLPDGIPDGAAGRRRCRAPALPPSLSKASAEDRRAHDAPACSTGACA